MASSIPRNDGEKKKPDIMTVAPDMNEWLKEAKACENAGKIGMYLVHNGAVRGTPKAEARGGVQGLAPVTGMHFTYDAAKVKAAEEETLKLPGIYYVRTWLNEGDLNVGDDIMYVLIGGDIRPRIVDALNFLVGTIKDSCVTETEKY